MPERKFTKYRAHGAYVYSTGSAPIASCSSDGTHEWEEREDMAKRIAAALNAAEEGRDRAWKGSGPTPKEAGGYSILVRYETGLMLFPLYWDKGAWCSPYNGKAIACEDRAVNWWPMPKA